MKKNWRLSVIFLVILALMLGLSGCAAPGQPAAQGNNASPAAGNSQDTQTTDPQYITTEEAQVIALAHAGLTADQVTGLRASFDRDDGVPEYEVEFRQDRWEYEYEIHAETGAILSWDKDD